MHKTRPLKIEGLGLSGLFSDYGLIVANGGQDVTSYRMIESAFRHHVTVSIAKMPSRPVLTVVVLTRALDAHRGDFYDPTATVDWAVLCTDWPDSVEASRDILEPGQVVHLDGR